MDLHTGRTLWSESDIASTSYPRLDRDVQSDVVVVGGGIGGAIAAWEIAERGLDVVVLERHRVGMGSTRGNTGLLQYANDMPLVEMIRVHGRARAVAFYRRCWEGLGRLREIVKQLPEDVEFADRMSVCYASVPAHISRLKDEARTLAQHGFAAELVVGRDELRRAFGIDREAAFVTYGDAEVNPLKFTRALLAEIVRRGGAQVFERTAVVRAEENDAHVAVETDAGFRVRARAAVFATGYVFQNTRPLAGARLGCTYAIATEPLSDLAAWPVGALIWETARPYLYMRTTRDRRLVVGGLDLPVPDGPRRDEGLNVRAEQLARMAQEVLPDIGSLSIAYRWASTFGSTVDGWPIVGVYPGFRRIFCALGYGGNGMVCYAVAADMLARRLVGKNRPEDEGLGPERWSLWRRAARRLSRAVRL
ncbi:NAD(P)/FAD-dependent oxidoreductase [Alicyclobacillus acidocaldarius]|uniref:FAD dependent oxidoreductase n=1 Tax=Alicyclobacillus acidocaldarius (strain Tc-4-1) TaxID=1048834 RepID=F8IH95_ALIAT|nr:FAD-dependent oxidoreductase [Alicyclobacillus acidocaldarius]AEJ43180.1 FAD dependent oxidoreductase [Alicyclobacillus acidocaldarius subsp. acidocaldarius Tc-4-1]